MTARQRVMTHDLRPCPAAADARFAGGRPRLAYISVCSEVRLSLPEDTFVSIDLCR